MTDTTKAADWSDADFDLLANVYQLLCTSRLNAIYYELRLSKLQKISFLMEVAIATTASGSGVASLVSNGSGWLGELGQIIWPIVAVTSAIAAVIRPIYAPGKKIESLTRQHQGYSANYFALKKLAFSIRQEHAVTNDHRRRFDTFFDRHVQLSTDAKAADDESVPDDKCRSDADARTRSELPPETFWWPLRPDGPAPPPQAG